MNPVHHAWRDYISRCTARPRLAIRPKHHAAQARLENLQSLRSRRSDRTCDPEDQTRSRPDGNVSTRAGAPRVAFADSPSARATDRGCDSRRRSNSTLARGTTTQSYPCPRQLPTLRVETAGPTTELPQVATWRRKNASRSRGRRALRAESGTSGSPSVRFDRTPNSRLRYRADGSR